MSQNQLIMLGVAGVVVCGGAILHGKKTDRWLPQRSERLIEYTKRLETVPENFGNWTSRQLEVNAAQFEASNCDGVFSRSFTNASTGDTVSVFLVTGRGYHCTIHTPDQCYVAAGFEMGKDPIGYTFKAPGIDQECEFVHTIFDKETPTETQRLRIFWLYSLDGKTWNSPKFAKYQYGEVDAMYKMYLIRSAGGPIPKISDDPLLSFAKQFLPLLNQSLGQTAAAPPASESSASATDTPASVPSEVAAEADPAEIN